MQNLLSQLANTWQEKIHPSLTSFISFFGSLWLGLCLVVLYGLAKLSGEVWEKESFTFDTTILLWIHQSANPVLDVAMVSITRLGDPRSAISIAVAILIFLWWRSYRLEAKFFALNALGGAILSYALKLTFGKSRPKLWPQLISETTFSYPSGHALGSMVLYGFLAYLLASLYPHHSRIMYGVAAFVIFTIGFSRLYLGVHWPTDIIAGYGVGFLWVTICISLMRLQQRKASSMN